MNFYRDASSILDQLDHHKGTIKGLCLQDKVRDKKKMYAVVCQTLKARPLLLEILEKAAFWKNEKKCKLSRNLLLVLLHDLLFCQRGIQAPDGPIKQTILSHKARFKAELAKLRLSRGALSNSELIEGSTKDQVPIPRYVRVNTILTTTEAVVATLSKRGYTHVSLSDIDWNDKKARWVSRDAHIDDLLLLPPGTDLHNDSLVTCGKIILQDKASCFTAFVLNPPPGSHVIDACAAPGNKTSHLAMLMGNSGTIWALDLDVRRLNTMKTLTQRAKASIIQPMHGNFLELDIHSPQFENVEYILLDPSCSGSGIVNRLDHLVDGPEAGTSEHDKFDRLSSLAEFQIQVMEHALKFPNVRRIAYSTCSVHTQENEDVVATILATHGKEWRLKKALPSWPRRGVSSSGLSQEQAACLVRCDPAHDATNGFFVALFEKIGHEPTNVKTHQPKVTAAQPIQTETKKRPVPPQETKKPKAKKMATSKKSKIRRSVTS
ncbi:hypothetical protein DSO57_1029618 [Entomophthora muscae]|uniref:Uncharacterized protein n=1 Tax=Entomophthora muscae TaxID=34485 RepID=A0ACC2TDD5_9FUNG|nr:hypothetical protein DSO57_1029618 [Entomophthora muscae]